MDTDLQNLITRFKDFPVVERKPSFLEIAGFPSRETVWRNIFAFFFKPNECHGFKDLFLRSFFDALGKQNQATGDFDLMTVTTECQTPKGNYLDLLIRCHDFAIGIEMKVNAGLYNDLNDYGKLVTAKNPDDEYRIVLTISPCNPHSGFFNLLYADLVSAIKQQLGNYVLAAEPKYTSLLLDFLDHVTRYIGGYAMTIDPKQLQFMQDNHETVIRLISTHHTLLELLEQRLMHIRDAVIALDTLEGVITQHAGPINYGGTHLIKFSISVAGFVFDYEVTNTPDYRNKGAYWFKNPAPPYTYDPQLTHAIKAAGHPYATFFDLSQSVEEVVAAIEQTILSLVDYLKKKHPPSTAQ
jgi:hypothetical protein